MALPDTLHAEVAGLLATKLRAPSLQQMRVPRQRLTVRLDEGDNDPARFWLHVTAALAGAAPDLGAASLGLLKAPDIGRSTPDPAALLNAAASIAGDVVLALDDFHLISSPAIHSALHYCVEHLPERLHLLILTRTDPPFPLARLRARDQLVEIRAGDLQFTLLEAAAFLNDVMHLGLQQDEVRLLADRTEGWIAGLQLAALSIRGRADAGEFITRFTGAHHFVLEYLVEEVLARQSSEVKSFLLRTSILGHLSGALCDAVTGKGDGQMLLRELERSNLFLVPLDDEHRWYRYHHLFADVLRARLEQSDPGLVPHLHEAAARWHEENGLEEDAVRHALAARNFERAARLMERAAVPLMARGEVTTLMAWTESIPAELRRQRPWLAVTHAWGELLTGYPGAVEPILGEIEPDQSPAAVATYLIGRAHTLADDRDQAAVAIEQAIGLARKAGHIYLAASAMCDLAGLELVRGRLGAAGRLYGEAARSAMELGLQVVSAPLRWDWRTWRWSGTTWPPRSGMPTPVSSTC